MSTSVKHTLDTCPPSDDDLNALALTFGECTCSSDGGTVFVWYLGLAIAAVILFLVMVMPATQAQFTRMFGEEYEIYGRTVAFGVIIFIIDTGFTYWRHNNVLCIHDCRACR